MERNGATRREVVRGMAMVTAGVCLRPMVAFGSTTPQGKGALPRSAPHEVGVDPAAVMAFVDAVNEKVGGLHSMMLLRHGKVAAEAWWAPFVPDQSHILYSLSKSFTSTAAGFAISEGKFRLTDKVVSFFPDKLPEKVEENLAAMTVRDLLTMNTGHDREAGRDGDDWVKNFLHAPVPHAPGTHFLYNTPATHVVAAIVTKATGERMLDYLTPRLFGPLAIEGATWDQSPAEIDIGGYGLKLKTEDIAKFGQLLLQRGKWDGKQVVPENWLEEATRKQVANGDPAQPNDWSQGYGYQFWMCQHGYFRGDGAFGQYCIVMPALDAVLAITSGVGDMGAILQAAWTHLAPGLKDGASATSEDALRAKLAAQEVPPPVGKPTSSRASEVGGKTWKIDANDEKIASVRIAFAPEGGTIETTMDGEVKKVEFGTSDWKRQGIVAVRAAWPTENELAVKVCSIDSPHEWSETYVFDGDRLTIKNRGFNVMFGPRERPDLHGTVG